MRNLDTIGDLRAQCECFGDRQLMQVAEHFAQRAPAQ
jgi:hypothetical protein